MSVKFKMEWKIKYHVLLTILQNIGRKVPNMPIFTRKLLSIARTFRGEESQKKPLGISNGSDKPSMFDQRVHTLFLFQCKSSFAPSEPTNGMFFGRYQVCEYTILIGFQDMELQTFDADSAYRTDCDVSYNRFYLLWVNMAPSHVQGHVLTFLGPQMRRRLFRAKELLCSLRYCEYPTSKLRT